MKHNYTYKSYFIGFVLSAILTIIPFCIVSSCDTIQKGIIINTITLCAIIQIFIHLIFFLHLGNISHQEWRLISLIFTIFIVFTIIFGSIWIMTHLHHNLMI